MAYRKPSEIIIRGVSLEERLRLHELWVRGKGGERLDVSGEYLSYVDLSNRNLTRANLTRADMTGTIMTRAIMTGAHLNGTTGNMTEIRSAQFDRWPVTWTQSADGVTTLQIGCQRHPLAMWKRADPRWIAAMDSNAPAWWAAYGKAVLGLVKAAPATPHAGTSKEGAA